MVQEFSRPLVIHRVQGIPTAVASQRTFRSWHGIQAVGFFPSGIVIVALHVDPARFHDRVNVDDAVFWTFDLPILGVLTSCSVRFASQKAEVAQVEGVACAPALQPPTGEKFCLANSAQLAPRGEVEDLKSVSSVPSRRRFNFGDNVSYNLSWSGENIKASEPPATMMSHNTPRWYPNTTS